MKILIPQKKEKMQIMSKKKNNYVAVGGQALMEGIMMKGPKGTAMSLRLPDGSIETQMKDFVSVRKKIKILNIPVVRGVVSFVESMLFGYKLLMESAEKTTMDLAQEESESKLDKWLSDHLGPKMMGIIGGIAAVLGVALAMFLFMWLPSFVFDIVNEHLLPVDISKFKAIFEGLIRVIIFVIYMFAVSKMNEIHRVYMYHGAEHKTIFCFEQGLELTVENVKKQKRCHPRCGTSFIFVTILLSIIVSSVVSVIFPVLTAPENRILWVALKILMIPLIMGIGFEFIQFAGKHQNKFTSLLSAPGLLMQRITTAEPTDDIIEVAIEAMKGALSGEVPETSKPKAEIEEKSSDSEAEKE